MFAFRADHRRLLAAAILAAVGAALGASGASAQQLYYEDFEDETLAGNAAIANGTIAGGFLSLDDPAAARGTFSVVQDFFAEVMTFSFDVVEPIVRGEPASMEVVLRAGVGTAQNTLQNADQVVESIIYRDGNRGAYVNNGNETIFLVANNKATDLVFNSPIDQTPVTLTAFQYIPYVLNHDTTTFGQIKGVSNFNGGARPITRLGIGSSSTAHVGTFAIDNVLVMTGATFERDLVQKQQGDVDGDMDVDMDDFTFIQNHFQQSVTMREEGDLNDDGMVDWVDFRQWKDNFPTPPPPPGGGAQGVPEPAGAILALGALLGIGRVRRRV